MIIPPWYLMGPPPRVLEARRKAIEKEVAAKGIVPGTRKFGEVVDRKFRKVRYVSTCRYDPATIPGSKSNVQRKASSRRRR